MLTYLHHFPDDGMVNVLSVILSYGFHTVSMTNDCTINEPFAPASMHVAKKNSLGKWMGIHELKRNGNRDLSEVYLLYRHVEFFHMEARIAEYSISNVHNI